MRDVEWSEWNSQNDNFQRYTDVASRRIFGNIPKNPGLVSIVILTHRRAHGLRIALDSALGQDFKDSYHITVVDDSGFDQATNDLMKEYCSKHDNITYYRHDKNIGQYASWNRACELSPTKWFCLLHDDDYLAPNYLSETVKVLKNPEFSNAGLLGVYFNTVDNRKNHQAGVASRIINGLTSLFIKFRNSRPIRITLDDNINHIYVLSCCLMINKEKVIEIGGLDDRYFPSADFTLSSKMNYYYSTVFLPKYLCYRGIGENESLKREVCEDSIRCAYYHTLAMLTTAHPTMSEKQKKAKASFAAVCAEIGVLGYDSRDYSETKRDLGMDEKYNSSLTRSIIMIKSRLLWGMLLFRNNKEESL